MESYPWIPLIPVFEKETPGPWGNSPEFYYALLNAYKTPENLQRVFKTCMEDIIENDNKESSLIVHNFLKILEFLPKNSTPMTGKELITHIDNITFNIENDGVTQQRFRDKIIAHITNKVQKQDSTWIRKMIDDLEAWKINLSDIINEILEQIDEQQK